MHTVTRLAWETKGMVEYPDLGSGCLQCHKYAHVHVHTHTHTHTHT